MQDFLAGRVVTRCWNIRECECWMPNFWLAFLHAECVFNSILHVILFLLLCRLWGFASSACLWESCVNLMQWSVPKIGSKINFYHRRSVVLNTHEKPWTSNGGGGYMEPRDFVWQNDIISYFVSLVSQRTIFSGTHAIFSGTHVVFQILKF